MSNKIITTYYASGYSLANNTNLYILPTGGVGGSGVLAKFHSTITNDGKVNGGIGTVGVTFDAGGVLINGSSTYTSAVVEGVSGLSVAGGAGSVTNYGTIRGIHSAIGGGDGVVFLDGGGLINGTSIDRTALVQGGQGVQITGAQGTVANFGTIIAAVAQGVVLYDGGNVTNGAVTDTAASISGVQQGVGFVFAGTLANFGTISGSGAAHGDTGVELNSGGQLTNGATSDAVAMIEGYTGALVQGPGTVTNYGAIVGLGASSYEHGVYLVDGGGVVNGTSQDTSALIEGGTGISIANASGFVNNYGTILGKGLSNIFATVEVRSQGVVINGAAGDDAALIDGGSGVRILGYGAVDNFGTITASRTQGVALYQGGFVTNGAGTDTGASISGNQMGVKLYESGTVTNFGTIFCSGVYQGVAGVYMTLGGKLINGTTRDLVATVSGYTGVTMSGAGTVTNYGSIVGLGAAYGDFGVDLSAGGTVTNGASTDRTASIEGDGGVSISGAAGTIRNAGTILATGGFGAQLLDGGAFTNGSASNTAALVQGYAGLLLQGGSATNFGTISALGDDALAVRLGSGAAITNGAAGHATALIEGYAGVEGYAAPGQSTTLTNFGTIIGLGQYAVAFGSSACVLNVEAGSSFVGEVDGDGGTLELASGTGTLTGLLSSGGNVTVSGSMAATTFQNFATVEVGSGASFTDTGPVTIAATQSVIDAGTLTLGGSGKNSIVNAGLIETTGAAALTLAGALANSFTGVISANGGTLIAEGAVTGGGHAGINGGTLDFASSFTENVTFSGSGVLELAQSQTYTGTITGFSKTSTTSLDLRDIAFVSSTEATFSGTKTGGVLTVTDGTHTAHINLKGNYLTSTFIASSDGDGGTIVVDPKAKAPVATPHLFIAAMAGHGADGAGGAIHAGEVGSVRQPVLAFSER